MGHDWLVIRFWLNHNLHGLKRVRAYPQANLDPESSKNLLVATNIAKERINKTVSHLLSLEYSLSLNLVKSK